MTQSQSTFGTISAITRLTHKALQSTNYRQLQRLEREVQALEADLSAASLPTNVWFDIPPNEWWEAN